MQPSICKRIRSECPCIFETPVGRQAAKLQPAQPGLVPGARVRLQGLSVAELNGQIGVLEAFQDERWAVPGSARSSNLGGSLLSELRSKMQRLVGV